MKTQDLFSMSVIVKDLGKVLVHLTSSLENMNIYEVDSVELSRLLSIYWERHSLIGGLEFNVIPDCSQVEGYEILVHRIGDPHILVSINFNLS